MAMKILLYNEGLRRQGNSSQLFYMASCIPTFSHETNYSIGELGHDALTGIKEVKKAYAK